jgi:hypothetical protein
MTSNTALMCGILLRNSVAPRTRFLRIQIFGCSHQEPAFQSVAIPAKGRVKSFLKSRIGFQNEPTRIPLGHGDVM